MSSAMDVTLYLRQLAGAAPVPPNLVSNSNLGTGAQKNSQQTGGCHNTQFNADTINYHGELASNTPSPTLRNTNGGQRCKNERGPRLRRPPPCPSIATQILLADRNWKSSKEDCLHGTREFLWWAWGAWGMQCVHYTERTED